LILTAGLASCFPEPADDASPEAAALLQVQLSRVVFPNFLARQLWFAAKGDRIDHVAITWQSLWKQEWLLTNVQVRLHHGATQTYSVPLALLWEQDGVCEQRAPTRCIGRGQ
jgi:hypothetical protein